MKLKILGSGSCELRGERSSPAYALVLEKATVLLDLGQGVWRRLAEEGLEASRVRGVVITHHHLDHFAGLLPLLFALRYDPLLSSTGDVEVVAHREISRVMALLEEAFGQWVVPEAGRLRWHWTGPGEHLEAAGVRIATAQAQHIPTSLAYRIEAEGASLVYLGDSRASQELAELARGADLLIAHCPSTPANPRPMHMSPEEAGALAAQGEVKALVLSHFYSDLNPHEARMMAAKHFPGRIWVASDGLEIDLGKDIHRGG